MILYISFTNIIIAAIFSSVDDEISARSSHTAAVIGNDMWVYNGFKFSNTKKQNHLYRYDVYCNSKGLSLQLILPDLFPCSDLYFHRFIGMF